MKNLLLYTAILIVTLSFTIENGRLSGVVTYRNPNGPANQADLGSEIYAINEADLRSTQYDDIINVVGNFQRNKSQYSLVEYNTIDPVRIKKNQDNFDALSTFACKYINGFKQLPAIVRAATNETGKYTLLLRPGKYYILFVSGSVKSNNIAEINGNIELETVDVKTAGETFLDEEYEKKERIWIKLITSWQPDGC